MLFKKKKTGRQLFTFNCLSENYPSMKRKKKVAPLPFLRIGLNIIINYTVNYLGLRWKGVCLSLKLMYFDSAPGGSSLWIMGWMRASEGRNHSLKWASARQGVNEPPHLDTLQFPKHWSRKNLVLLGTQEQLGYLFSVYKCLGNSLLPPWLYEVFGGQGRSLRHKAADPSAGAQGTN